MVEPVEILRYARDVVLDSPEKWVQGEYHVPAKDRVCTVGALSTATMLAEPFRWPQFPLSVTKAPLLSVLREVGWDAIEDFNDDPDTTYEDVISLFDKAIKQCEES